eukprot:6211465-Pleurochrysis_carterae.AAC.2
MSFALGSAGPYGTRTTQRLPTVDWVLTMRSKELLLLCFQHDYFKRLQHQTLMRTAMLVFFVVQNQIFDAQLSARSRSLRAHERTHSKNNAQVREGSFRLETDRVNLEAGGVTEAVVGSKKEADAPHVRCIAAERPDKRLFEWSAVQLAGLRAREMDDPLRARRDHPVVGVAAAQKLTQCRGQPPILKHEEVAALA